MTDQLATEGFCHAFRRNVVMGRADAAGGEDIIVLCPHGVYRFDDFILDIRYHTHFSEANTRLVVQLCCDIGKVRVLYAAG